MVLPKCNYLVWNSPVCITGSFFRNVDCCITSSIWNDALLRLAKSTLHLSVQLGGLALPNFQVYYWVAVLVTIYWWFEGSWANAAVCVEAAYLGSLSDFQNLVYRGAVAYADIAALWLRWYCGFGQQQDVGFTKTLVGHLSNLSGETPM